MKPTETIIRTPGRVCLFGDHQDYLGLPVIAAAIDRWITLQATPIREPHFHILLPDIGEERFIQIDDPIEQLAPSDFLASALRVVRRYDCVPKKGYQVKITSDIPINAGLSSSSALTVCWIHFLLEVFGCSKKVDSEFIGQLAYEAEVLEHSAPGGKMDQYTCAIGSVLHIDTSENFSWTVLGEQLNSLVIAESGIPKYTGAVLSKLKTAALKGIEEIKQTLEGFNISEVTEETLESFLKIVSEKHQIFLDAAVRNHLITQQAIQEFQKNSWDLRTLGTLMNQHHGILKDSLQLTVPEIDTLIDTALEAGAYGAKIVGSGGGGCIVALVEESLQPKLVKKLKQAGAKDAYSVKVAGGSTIVKQ